jgi:hypothetical protein
MLRLDVAHRGIRINALRNLAGREQAVVPDARERMDLGGIRCAAAAQLVRTRIALGGIEVEALRRERHRLHAIGRAEYGQWRGDEAEPEQHRVHPIVPAKVPHRSLPSIFADGQQSLCQGRAMPMMEQQLH